MRVKELVAVSEVDRALTKAEVKGERIPDSGFWVERRVEEEREVEKGV